MELSPNDQFLQDAAQQARAAGHIYPEMAACEAALESSWGHSGLALEANNLFGQKQAAHPQYGTFALPTREYLHGAWVTEEANWIKFPSLAACFAERLATLKRLAPSYPNYAAALAALTAEAYVTEVSRSWSTDPQRAAKCISIYNAHRVVLDAAVA